MVSLVVLQKLLGFTFLDAHDKHMEHRWYTEAGMHTELSAQGPVCLQS